MHYNICVTLHFNGSKESATTTQMLVMYVKAVTHQANSRLSAKVRPSLSVCQLSFWSVFHTIGTSWAPSVPFLPIEHVESTIGSQWDRSLWLAIQLCTRRIAKVIKASKECTQRRHSDTEWRKWRPMWFMFKMVSKRWFVCCLYICSPSFGFSFWMTEIDYCHLLV